MQKYNKFWVALGAALGVSGTALSDGAVSPEEGIAIAIAFSGAVGVFFTTNKKR